MSQIRTIDLAWEIPNQGAQFPKLCLIRRIWRLPYVPKDTFGPEARSSSGILIHTHELGFEIVVW